MIICLLCGAKTAVRCDRWDCPDLASVNSDPDAELSDPEDDTIGFPGDPMADYDLDGDEDEDEEEDDE